MSHSSRLAAGTVMACLLVALTAAAQEPGPRLHWTDAPTLDIGETFHSELHAQGILVARDVPPALQASATPSPFEFRRARVGIAGAVASRATFQVERDLTDAHAPWRDVYVDLRQSRWLRVRAGRFKMPFSADQLMSSPERTFINRSRAATYLAPGRDIGVMVHGRSARRLTYSLGVFRRDGDRTRTAERIARGRNRTVAGRVVVTPFTHTARWSKTLSIGASVTASELPEGLNNLRGKTIGDRAVIPALAVSGARHRYGVDGSWSGGPVDIRAESMTAIDARHHQSLDGSTLPAVTVRGYLASAVWRLGRHHRRTHVAVADVGVRWEGLLMPGDTSAGASLSPRALTPPDIRLHAVTVTATWAPVRVVRLRAEIGRERFTSAAIGTASGWSPAVGMQVAF